MALSDEDLLEFNHLRLHMEGDVTPRKLLNEHGEVYRAQLVAARWLADLANGFDVEAPGLRQDDGFMRGQAVAYRDVVKYLLQGNFLPGSRAYDEGISGT